MRACERFHILPEDWEKQNVHNQARLIAYSQIRELEEFNEVQAMSGIR